MEKGEFSGLILSSLFDPVFHQGDEGKSWYIILKGSVNVVIRGKGKENYEWFVWQIRSFCCNSNFFSFFAHHYNIFSSPSKIYFDACFGLVIRGKGAVTSLYEGDDFGKLALVNDAPR